MHDLPVNETHGRSAEADDCREIVADKENRSTFSGRDTLDFANAIALKLSVANRQNLVHDEYFRFQMCGDGKGELDPHVPRVAFHRLSRNFSTSANATISSNLRRISARVMPRIAPLR